MGKTVLDYLAGVWLLRNAGDDDARQAGFDRHGNVHDVPCAPCRIGLGDVWFTINAEIAAKFERFASRAAQRKLQTALGVCYLSAPHVALPDECGEPFNVTTEKKAMLVCSFYCCRPRGHAGEHWAVERMHGRRFHVCWAQKGA